MTTPSPLISPETFKQQLAAGHEVALIDCQASLGDPAQGRRDWLAGHLPGAVHLDLETDLSGPITAASGRHPLPAPEAFEMSLSSAGVRPDHPVVVYDDAGGAFAVRCWWLLRWLGHADVRVLDGGLSAWREAGGELEAGETAPEPGTYRGKRDGMPVLSTADVEGALRDARICLLDARSEARFRGEQEPIDPVAGHVPGAINHPFQSNLDSHGRWRSAEELREQFRQRLGQCQPQTVVHMCGSGVTACHNLFAMELAGLSGSALYAGSWSEWIRDPDRPVVTSES